MKCCFCHKKVKQTPSAVNRAIKKGLPIFCDRICFGKSRQKHKTKAQKVAEKKTYDREYRAKNLAWIKEKKREYFERTYDPKKAAIERKKRMPKHVEYCRRPEYKLYKSKYDLQRRAAEFGPFSESYLLLLKIKREVNERVTQHERRIINGTYNKAEFRRRDYRCLVGKQPEGSSLGHT